MSELVENNDLNETVEEEVDDSPVVTVPIDDTLTHSGEAADAKKVGDELAKKADKSEVGTNITVNGQTKDAQGNILVKAEHIPYSTGQGGKTVKEKIDDIDGKTAEDIPMSSGENPQTVAEAIADAGAKTADQIPMEEGSIKTVAEAIGEVAEAVSSVSQALTQYEQSNDEIVQSLQQAVVELTDEEIHQIVSEVFEGEPEEEEES